MVVRPDVEVASRDGSQFRAWFRHLSRRAMQLVAQTIDGCPEVGHLQTHDDISLADGRRSALRLIQRMKRRKIHPAPLVDHRRLQYLGEFDELRHRSRRSREPVGDQHRILCSNEKAC